MKDVSGGGSTTAATTGSEVAPDPAPAPGAQPAAPARVTGGGATAFEAAPEPTQCGQWVPAPVVVGGDTPPEPIAGPGSKNTDGSPTPAGTTPASQLSTWPEWQQQFRALGLDEAEIARIGGATLGNAQLAEVYEDIHTGIVERGGVPGEGLPAQTAWSPAWEQRFLALGLPPQFVAELKAQAQKSGAGEAQLERVYGTIAQQVAPGGKPGQQVPGTPGLPGQQVPGTPGLPGQQQPPVQQGPGWNPQVEQAFRSLGMPDEVLALYAQSGAPLSGLEAAYKHAAGRVEDFKQRGWMDKFTEAKVPPVETWALILGDQPASDTVLQERLDAHKKGQESIWQKGGQLATSLFPGGRLAQYVFGKEFVSGEKIDRTNPMEIGMAALSGLAAFAAFRGAKTITAGWAARNGNYAALNGVNNTLAKLGLPATGAASMTDAAMGATQTWGTKQKLISLIPGTQLHKQVVGLGHAEAAARAFNAGGAASLMKDADGALQVATLAQMFDDIKTGATRINGGALAYLGPFRKAAPMVFDPQKGVINVAKNLKIGNGNSQLVSLMEVGGQRLGADPSWLRNAANLGKEVGELAKVERDALGRIMAGNAARNLETFTKDGFRPMRYIATLRSDKQPEWYSRLAAETAKQWTGGAKPIAEDLLDVLTAQKLWSGIAGESTDIIRGIDRTGMSKEMSGMLDEAATSLDELRDALDAAKAGGKIDDATGAAFGKFADVVGRIDAQDAELAKKVFPTFADHGAFVMAQAKAADAAKSALAAQTGAAAAGAASVADDVVETVVANADEATEAVAANTDDLAKVVAANTDDVAETVAAPAADAAEGAAMAATKPRPANEPVKLGVNAHGEVVTPEGLIVPSFAAPASGVAPAGASGDVARFQKLMDRYRRGPAA